MLDGTYPASTLPGRGPSSPSGEGPSAAVCSAPPPRRSRPRAESPSRLLTPSVARRVRPLSRASTPRQARFHHAPVKERGFHEPGRLPSTSAPDSPLSRTAREPATDLAALPPPSRLPTRLHRPPLSRGRLDPPSSSELFAPSAEGHAPLVDFCNRTRSTSTTPDRPNPAHRRKVALADSAFSGGWPHPFRGWANQVVTGQGPDELPPGRRLYERSLARRASPRPDRLGHLVSPPRRGYG